MARRKIPKYEYLEDSNRYRKRVKNAEGKYISLYGRTPAELTEKIEAFREKEQFSGEDKDNPLVSSYVQRWFRLNCSNLRDASKADYQRIINYHILPHLGDMRIRDVYPNDIKRVMSNAVDKSQSVHNKTFMLLKRIFTAAYENGDIENNPCPQMHNGGNAPPEKQALSDEQVSILLDALKNTKAYLFCLIALDTGMRSEEILGLAWDCVHLEGTPRIEVKRASRFENGQPVISTDLKSAAAKRTIPIPRRLIECLREEKQNTNSEYVVSNTNGDPVSKAQFRRIWNFVTRRSTKKRYNYRYVDGKVEKYEIDVEYGKRPNSAKYHYTINFNVTPHILRHTYITNLLLAGVDIKTVQYLAGHEKSKTTLDIYTHLTYNRPEEIGKKIDTVFEG